MSPSKSSLIDVVELVYDLELSDEEWVPALLEQGLPLFNHGYGVVCTTYQRPPEGGMPWPTKSDHAGGPPDLGQRILDFGNLASEELLREVNRSGVVTTLSETLRTLTIPAPPIEAFQAYLAGARDALALTAVDPNGIGISIVAPLEELTTLKGRHRNRWQMVGAHLVSGFRLRHGVQEARDARQEPAPLPNRAEAVLDPKVFKVVEATGRGKTADARECLREAALQMDRARGRLRTTNPDQALDIWKGLVDGRWSLVDWFDRDGRRFVLAHPNPPDIKDPRGLTERERQVATYAALGEKNKLISYRLGISQPKISSTLRSAMRKLGVNTRAQLVERFATFERVA